MLVLSPSRTYTLRWSKLLFRPISAYSTQIALNRRISFIYTTLENLKTASIIRSLLSLVRLLITKRSHVILKVASGLVRTLSSLLKILSYNVR
jgi:tryptophan-rich sensory protein